MRWNGIAIVNLLIAATAAATMLIALYVVLVRPQIVSSDSSVRDSSGNEVIRAPDRTPISQSFPEDGFEFDQAAIDAVLKRPAPSSIAVIVDANGNVVPTDPVRYAAPNNDAEAAATTSDGRRSFARVEPNPHPDGARGLNDARDVPAQHDAPEAHVQDHARTVQPTPRRRHDRHAALPGADFSSASAGGTFNGSALIAEARRYLGTNPTKRQTLWCGAFLDMVLRRTGHPGGGNLALAYARYGKRIPGPRVGAIVVLRRKGGGHVGIVTGVDGNGNPVVISGNHGHKVGVGVYPRSRVVAYVVP